MSFVTVLDGGMSRELMRLGAPFRQPEWSALALIESPDHVRQAHGEFARAGAEVLTTNAYAVVPYHIGDRRFAESGHSLGTLAASLARDVADDHAGVRVAGCLPPPLGSYRPEAFDEPEARSILEVLIDAQAPFVDIWLAETMSSTDEASVATRAVRESGSAAPLWVAFTIDDDDGARLRSGESVVDAVRAAEGWGAEVVAFNCSQPEVLEVSVAVAAEVATVPVGVYANVLHGGAGEGANVALGEVRSDATVEAYAAWSDRWIAAGASLVGGCCGTDARHIATLSAHLR